MADAQDRKPKANQPAGAPGTSDEAVAPSYRPRVHKYLTKDLTVRASAVVATEVVEAMRSLQNCYPIPTVAVGRSMVASLLMASHLKNKQELSVYLQGTGPLSRVFAEATFEGHVRGFSSHPQLESPSGGDKILVGPALGIGLLTVTHHTPIGGAPHRGTVELVTGEVGDDIAYYLQQSHQIGSIVSLGVHLNAYGKVEAAGGVLIELMPGHSEDVVKSLEAKVKNARAVSSLILDGARAEDLVKEYLSDFELIEMDHDYPISYQCRCNRDRVKRSIGLLGVQELDEMIEKAESPTITCEFCGRPYELTLEEIKEVRDEVYRESLN